MMRPVSVGLIGDYQPTIPAHIAVPKALALAAQTLGYNLQITWIATFALEEQSAQQLAAYDALWCVPGSPYVSMTGALLAIRFAREQRRPFLGTCGGFQHALLEYARNVLGLGQADHAESSPNAELPFIFNGLLTCTDC